MGYEGALSSEEGREMVTIESCLQVTHSQEEKTLSLGDREVISREQEVAFREQEEQAEATDWSKSKGRRKMW